MDISKIPAERATGAFDNIRKTRSKTKHQYSGLNRDAADAE